MTFEVLTQLLMEIKLFWNVTSRRSPNIFRSLVNESNLVQYFFLVYSVNFIYNPTCFGPLQFHHQEEILYFRDTWYLLYCITDCLVCRSICSCIPDSQLSDSVQRLYVQQPSTYAKPEAASAVLGS
jgi:hypothetical protein